MLYHWAITPSPSLGLCVAFSRLPSTWRKGGSQGRGEREKNGYLFRDQNERKAAWLKASSPLTLILVWHIVTLHDIISRECSPDSLLLNVSWIVMIWQRIFWRKHWETRYTKQNKNKCLLVFPIFPSPCTSCGLNYDHWVLVILLKPWTWETKNNILKDVPLKQWLPLGMYPEGQKCCRVVSLGCCWILTKCNSKIGGIIPGKWALFVWDAQRSARIPTCAHSLLQLISMRPR